MASLSMSCPWSSMYQVSLEHCHPCAERTSVDWIDIK